MFGRGDFIYCLSPAFLYFLSTALSPLHSNILFGFLPNSHPTSAEANRKLLAIGLGFGLKRHTRPVRHNGTWTLYGPTTASIGDLFTLGITKDGRYIGQYVRWEALEQGCPSPLAPPCVVGLI